MEPESRRVAAADELSLHLLDWSREGVSFLMLHGFGNDAHVWDDFAPVVAPHYRTLALDLRGHGDSDRDAQLRYDQPALARDVVAVADALGIERLVLMGHSLGARVAMRFAGTHAERLAGLVLVDAGPELDPRGITRIRLSLGSEAPVGFASSAEYEAVLARAYPLARPETLARMARHGLRTRPDGTLEPKTDPAFGRLARRETPEEALRRQAADEAELWSALARADCPALVVRGAASDVLSQDVAERMVEALGPRASLALIPRAGHPVMIDNPEGFRDAVAAFVLGEG